MDKVVLTIILIAELCLMMNVGDSWVLYTSCVCEDYRSFGEPGEPSNPRVLGSVVIQVSQGSVLALGFGNKLWGCFGST